MRSWTRTVNLAEKLAAFDGCWSPKNVGSFDGHDVMVGKMPGAFVRHDHAESVSVTLGPGERYVMPRGAQHRPRADVKTHLLLIEPAGTPNTGDPASAARKVWI